MKKLRSAQAWIARHRRRARVHVTALPRSAITDIGLPVDALYEVTHGRTLVALAARRSGEWTFYNTRLMKLGPDCVHLRRQSPAVPKRSVNDLSSFIDAVPDLIALGVLEPVE